MTNPTTEMFASFKTLSFAKHFIWELLNMPRENILRGNATTQSAQRKI